MKIIFLALLSYLYGAVPFAYIATYQLKGKDLRQEGTGNIGVTNAYKVGGFLVVLITIIGEVTKAFVPLFLAHYFFSGSLYLALLFLSCSFVGTNVSIFLKGKGGKGSTIVIWGLLVLSPYALAALLLIWCIIFKLSRGNSMIKRIWLLFVPLVIFFFERDVMFAVFGLLYSLFCFLKSFKTIDDFAYYRIFQKKLSPKQ